MELSENESLKIKIDNYSGPLEVLLDLAKSQKVNLASISITQLADQFIEFINTSKKINLELASEYLLMATWLTYLKSKLLLPEDDEDDFIPNELYSDFEIYDVDEGQCELFYLETGCLDTSSSVCNFYELGECNYFEDNVDMFFASQRSSQPRYYSL